MNIQAKGPDLRFDIVLTNLVISFDEIGRALWRRVFPEFSSMSV